MSETIYAEKREGTYTTFGGMDVVLAIDKKTRGEIQSIKVDSIKKEITINLLSFSHVYTKETLDFYKNASTLLECISNEYGDKACFKYNNLKYKGYRKKCSIEDMYFTNECIYTYDSEELIEWEKGVSLMEIIKQKG